MTNCVTFHNTGGSPPDLAQISPYLTEHIKRLGGCSTHELAVVPDAYGTHLNVGFSRLDPDSEAA